MMADLNRKVQKEKNRVISCNMIRYLPLIPPLPSHWVPFFAPLAPQVLFPAPQFLTSI